MFMFVLLEAHFGFLFNLRVSVQSLAHFFVIEGMRLQFCTYTNKEWLV